MSNPQSPPSSWTASFETLQAALTGEHPVKNFITCDAACITIKNKIAQLSTLPYTIPITVLITGQSGAGKSILAAALKGLSLTTNPPPFLTQNVAALPETLAHSLLQGHVKGAFTGAIDERQGIFEAAGKGVVFLDEIGDMPLSQQPILLRILENRVVTPVGATQERPIHCRIVCATNRDLYAMANEGTFRRDLLGRLRRFHFHIPDFKSRGDDIELIGRHYGLSNENAEQLRYAPHFEAITQYGVRHIIDCVERLKLFGEIL